MSTVSIVRPIFLLLFLLAVVYFSYRGFVQVLNQQTSTRAEYRFGDDDKGNLEMFDITVCPKKDQLAFEKVLKGGKNLSALIEEASKGWAFEDFVVGVSLDVTPNSPLVYESRTDNNSWIPKWTHVLDWQSGHCFTFSPSAQGMKSTPITAYNTYDNSQWQHLLLKVIFLFLLRFLFRL